MSALAVAAMGQGKVGLAIALVGGVMVMAGDRLERASFGGDAALFERVKARIRIANLGAIVIAIAIGIYLVGRQMGHGRSALYACTGILLANAGIVAALRILRVDGVMLGDSLRRYRRGVFLETLGLAAVFVGLSVYLLRP